MYGVVWVSGVNVVDRVAHGGGRVMVWAGVYYGIVWSHRETPSQYSEGHNISATHNNNVLSSNVI